MWILILFAHVGVLGNTDSNSLTTAIYSSNAACERADKAAKTLASGTTKEIRYVCTQQ